MNFFQYLIKAAIGDKEFFCTKNDKLETLFYSLIIVLLLGFFLTISPQSMNNLYSHDKYFHFHTPLGIAFREIFLPLLVSWFILSFYLLSIGNSTVDKPGKINFLQALGITGYSFTPFLIFAILDYVFGHFIRKFFGLMLFGIVLWNGFLIFMSIKAIFNLKPSIAVWKTFLIILAYPLIFIVLFIMGLSSK